jgi:hypothetical protein
VSIRGCNPDSELFFPKCKLAHRCLTDNNELYINFRGNDYTPAVHAEGRPALGGPAPTDTAGYSQQYSAEAELLNYMPAECRQTKNNETMTKLYEFSMWILVVWFILLASFFTMAQVVSTTEAAPAPAVENAVTETAVSAPAQPAINIRMPDTIQIKNVAESSQAVLGIPGTFLPWIIVFVIAVVAILASIYAGLRAIKATEQNNIRQLQNAKEIALTGFTAALGTQKTGEWVDDLRGCLNDLMSAGLALHMEAINPKADPDRFQAYLEKLVLVQNQTYLLLDKKDEAHGRLEKSIAVFINAIGRKREDFKVEDYRNARKEIVETARGIFRQYLGKDGLLL